MSQDILSTFNNARPPSSERMVFFLFLPFATLWKKSVFLSPFKSQRSWFFLCQYDSSTTYNSFSSTIILVFLTKASPHKSFDSSNFSNSWSSNLRRFFLILLLPKTLDPHPLKYFLILLSLIFKISIGSEVYTGLLQISATKGKKSLLLS